MGHIHGPYHAPHLHGKNLSDAAGEDARPNRMIVTEFGGKKLGHGPCTQAQAEKYVAHLSGPWEIIQCVPFGVWAGEPVAA
jgi:hypothetical protein